MLLNSHISTYARCLAGKVCGLVRSNWGTSLGEDKLGARDRTLKVARRARRATIPPKARLRLPTSISCAPLHFSITVQVPADGDWEFYIETHGAARLLIDRQVVADVAGGAREGMGRIGLTRAAHTLQLLYAHGGPEQEPFLSLEWRNAGYDDSPRPITVTSLSPAPPPTGIAYHFYAGRALGAGVPDPMLHMPLESGTLPGFTATPRRGAGPPYAYVFLCEVEVRCCPLAALRLWPSGRAPPPPPPAPQLRATGVHTGGCGKWKWGADLPTFQKPGSTF